MPQVMRGPIPSDVISTVSRTPPPSARPASSSELLALSLVLKLRVSDTMLAMIYGFYECRRENFNAQLISSDGGLMVVSRRLLTAITWVRLRKALEGWYIMVVKLHSVDEMKKYFWKKSLKFFFFFVIS